MRIRNNNPLDLEGDNGEQITVKISASGTVFAVAYDLDGNAGNFSTFHPFTLNKAANNPSVLVLFFTFSNKKGGLYEIDVSGNNGGNISHYKVSQFLKEPDDAIAYAINVI
jgi:hypothetical protein